MGPGGGGGRIMRRIFCFLSQYRLNFELPISKYKNVERNVHMILFIRSSVIAQQIKDNNNQNCYRFIDGGRALYWGGRPTMGN